jgi:hypothetical protein
MKKDLKTNFITRYRTNEHVVMIFMAMVVGLLGGYGAVVF